MNARSPSIAKSSFCNVSGYEARRSRVSRCAIVAVSVASLALSHFFSCSFAEYQSAAPLLCSARVHRTPSTRSPSFVCVHPPAKCDRPLTQYHLQPLRFAPHAPRVSTRPPIIRSCVTAKINDVNGKALPLSASALTGLRDATKLRLDSRLFRLPVGLFWRNAGRRHGDQNEGSVTRH
jgi:hypothetical protein